jgi:hypothetical protein
MKTLSVLLLGTAILVVAVGFYRIWFVLSLPAAGAGTNKVHVNLTADPGKMKQDVEMVKDKAAELLGGVTQGVKADGQENDYVQPNDRKRTRNAVTNGRDGSDVRVLGE